MNISYEWEFGTTKFPKNRGKVFSCFACGGGSTMGYKLAGFDVLGCNEIDKKMIDMYIKNHKPKYSFLESITEFKNRKDLPDELFALDILDGSPPCSSFSLSGNREKDWGKEKKFREGQKKQILDTLFFDFIDLAKRIKPKIIIAENVKGLLIGEAKEYLRKIIESFHNAGYFVRFDLLDASKMGVPQRRERVFFSAIRKDIFRGDFDDLFQTIPSLKLNFNDKEIPFGKVRKETGNESAFNIAKSHRELWRKTNPGDSFAKVHPKGHFFNDYKLSEYQVCPTIRANDLPFDYKDERYLFTEEAISIGAFPKDYNFLENKPGYVIGMSVPPLMTAKLSDEIFKQWVEK